VSKRFALSLASAAVALLLIDDAAGAVTLSRGGVTYLGDPPGMSLEAEYGGQVVEEQARRAIAAESAQEAALRTKYALEALSSAYHRLEFGDSAVLDAVEYARPALPYPAQLALDNARGAIQSEDLAAARYWISLAIVETQQYQSGH
jgi:hypothetical protein